MKADIENGKSEILFCKLQLITNKITLSNGHGIYARACR